MESNYFPFPRLNGPQSEISTDLLELQQQHWVNNHTRAVFLEFSVYNAGINLFGICTIVAEFIPGGGIKPYYRIEPVRLLHYHESSGTFFLVRKPFFTNSWLTLKLIFNIISYLFTCRYAS